MKNRLFKTIEGKTQIDGIGYRLSDRKRSFDGERGNGKTFRSEIEDLKKEVEELELDVAEMSV